MAPGLFSTAFCSSLLCKSAVHIVLGKIPWLRVRCGKEAISPRLPDSW